MTLNIGDLERQINERGSIERLSNGALLISELMPDSGLAQGGFDIVGGAGVEEPEHHGIMHF